MAKELRWGDAILLGYIVVPIAIGVFAITVLALRGVEVSQLRGALGNPLLVLGLAAMLGQVLLVGYVLWQGSREES